MSQFSRFITQGSYPEIQVAFFQTLSEKGGGRGGGGGKPQSKSCEILSFSLIFNYSRVLMILKLLSKYCLSHTQAKVASLYGGETFFFTFDV